jgi:hypothetical protein
MSFIHIYFQHPKPLDCILDPSFDLDLNPNINKENFSLELFGPLQYNDRNRASMLCT